MKINRLDANHLRNDAHFQFYGDFRDLVVRCGAEKLKIKQQFDEFVTLYDREDEALKKIIKSAFTEKIHEADKIRDNLYGAIVEINNAYLKHYDFDTREAAKRLKIVFDTYGNISKKPVKEQTSAVHNILQELCGKYAADCVKVKISDWVSRLATENEELNRLMSERFDESAAKTDVVMREARREVDEVYRKICEIINVYVILDGAANYEQFIKTLNIIIAKYAIKHHHHSSISSGSSSGGGNPSDGDVSGGDVGGGSHGGGQHGGIQYEPPLYDPNKHYTEYQLGDAVRLPNGDIYQVKDLGYVHYAPDSANGHWGWEKI
jgi:hypothetical protein